MTCPGSDKKEEAHGDSSLFPKRKSTSKRKERDLNSSRETVKQAMCCHNHHHSSNLRSQ